MSRAELSRAVTIADIKLFASILPVLVASIYFGVNLQYGQTQLEKNQSVTNLKLDLYGNTLQNLDRRETKTETILEQAQRRGEITLSETNNILSLPGLTFVKPLYALK